MKKKLSKLLFTVPSVQQNISRKKLGQNHTTWMTFFFTAKNLYCAGGRTEIKKVLRFFCFYSFLNLWGWDGRDGDQKGPLIFSFKEILNTILIQTYTYIKNVLTYFLWV